jgi:hypothetical protein
MGYSKHGQLGHGNPDPSTGPTIIKSLEGRMITQVACIIKLIEL